jgi:hypothetical protein
VRLLLPEGETGGDSLVTYTHHFLMADGSPAWVISFTNGHVTDKPACRAKRVGSPLASAGDWSPRR